MTTSTDAYQAGIDAVVADNALTRGGFIDAIQATVTGIDNQEGGDWVDAIAVEFARLGVINNPTFNNLRGNIIDDAVAHRELFDALSTLGRMAETQVIDSHVELMTLREDRDNTNDALDRLDVLITNEPAGPARKQVREVLRQGKDALKGERELIRQRIQQITGDPDS
jgi:hypothetical protein